jgi:hypothetical protein
VQPTRRQVAALTERLSGAWHARHPQPEVVDTPLEPELERRLAAIADRLDHVEASLEGMQDAMYRQSVLADERNADLRDRTDPERLARELSDDARRRGL